MFLIALPLFLKTSGGCFYDMGTGLKRAGHRSKDVGPECMNGLLRKCSVRIDKVLTALIEMRSLQAGS